MFQNIFNFYLHHISIFLNCKIFYQICSLYIIKGYIFLFIIRNGSVVVFLLLFFKLQFTFFYKFTIQTALFI